MNTLGDLPKRKIVEGRHISYRTPVSTTEKCLGDISTHKIVKGQVWQNYFNPEISYEILEVKSRKNIKVKSCYTNFNTEKRCCDILEDINPFYTLRDCILIKE